MAAVSHHPRRLILLCVSVVLILVPGCARGDEEGQAHAGSTSHSAPGSSSGGRALPTSHVHAIERDSASGLVHVATHDGLVTYGASGPGRKVGPSIDLMGFATAEPGRLLASGHPGVGSDLPQPVGLIESTDGGRSWKVLSRGGESDFHALTWSSAGVLGFDGTLRHSTDGSTWRDLPLSAQAMSVASSPNGTTLVVSTVVGLQRSTDGGRTWAVVADAPVMLLDWAEGDVVAGVNAAGVVHLSDDAGRTWRASGAPALGVPQAIGTGRHDGAVELFVVTHDGIMRSTDGGLRFAAW